MMGEKLLTGIPIILLQVALVLSLEIIHNIRNHGFLKTTCKCFENFRLITFEILTAGKF